MTIDFSKMFDSYNRQARLYPGLLTALPLVLTIYAWFPSLVTSNAVQTFISVAVTCGLLYALASISRTFGKSHEPRLLKVWGGWPASLWLRHSDTNLSAQTRARYHAFFLERVRGLKLPSAQEEELDESEAVRAYDSAIDWLKEQCRSKDFHLVHRENAQYGFRRNLRGLKVFGIVITLASLLLTAGMIAHMTFVLLPQLPVLAILAELSSLIWASVLVSVLFLFWWLFMVNDSWVREAGDQYARSLLANCDALATKI